MRCSPSIRSLTLTAGVALLLATFTGCGYGEVSPTAYEYAKALYSVSNRQSVEKIAAVRAKIDASLDAGDLAPHEADWLTEVCDDCEAGRWEKATERARRMMEDQVRR